MVKKKVKPRVKLSLNNFLLVMSSFSFPCLVFYVRANVYIHLYQNADPSSIQKPTYVYLNQEMGCRCLNQASKSNSQTIYNNICRTIFYYIEKCVLTYVQQLNIIESLGNSVCIAWTAVKHDHGFLTKEYSTETIHGI